MLSDDMLPQFEDASDDPLRWAFLAGANLLRARRATLLLRDCKEPILSAAAAIGVDPAVVSEIRVFVGDGIAGRVAERGMLLVGTHDKESFLCVPILTDRGIEGVLNFTDRHDGTPFGEHDVTVASMLAQHVGALLQASRSTHGPAVFHRLATSFRETLDGEVARSKRAGVPITLVLISLSRLEEIEENAGPPAVDRVLQNVENALRASHRRYDVVARVSSDSLALILALPTTKDYIDAPRIRNAVNSVLSALDTEIEVSVGHATCPEDGLSATALLDQAQARIQRDE